MRPDPHHWLYVGLVAEDNFFSDEYLFIAHSLVALELQVFSLS
jgi:hypothetical protein